MNWLSVIVVWTCRSRRCSTSLRMPRRWRTNTVSGNSQDIDRVQSEASLTMELRKKGGGGGEPEYTWDLMSVGFNAATIQHSVVLMSNAVDCQSESFMLVMLKLILPQVPRKRLAFSCLLWLHLQMLTPPVCSLLCEVHEDYKHNVALEKHGCTPISSQAPPPPSPGLCLAIHVLAYSCAEKACGSFPPCLQICLASVCALGGIWK